LWRDAACRHRLAGHPMPQPRWNDTHLCMPPNRGRSAGPSLPPAIVARRWAARVAIWARRLELPGVAALIVGSGATVFAAFGPGVGSAVGKVGAVVACVGASVYLTAALLERRVSSSSLKHRHQSAPRDRADRRLERRGFGDRRSGGRCGSMRRSFGQLSADGLVREGTTAPPKPTCRWPGSMAPRRRRPMSRWAHRCGPGWSARESIVQLRTTCRAPQVVAE
jgi:hypothetical protein